MDDELLDLVNAQDEVIGTINRKDYKTLVDKNLGYIRASELFIMNDQGQVWIPVRTAHKTIAPNGFDYSAAGQVESGDDYLTTMVRETKEELNLDISEDQIELITKEKSEQTRYIHCIYLLRRNETPNFNPDDFTTAQWMTPAELISEIDKGHAAKDSLRGNAIKLQDYLRS